MMMKNKYIIIGISLIAIIGTTIVAFEYFETQKPTNQQLIVSTTTSFYETGFLDFVKKSFEAKYAYINVSFISQGTGLAIQTAKRGDADMILVHDPGQELSFLTGGYGVNRKIIAYNFFVIVGPNNDPAGITGLAPLDALKKLKSEGDSGTITWVSRGDGSGTHSKEKNLWKDAGFNSTLLRKLPWYLERGAGMTDTLKLADEKDGYTLTDLASYLNNYKKGNIKLKIVVEQSKDLLNIYSVIANNPQKTNLTGTNFDATMKFINYVTSDEGQQLFADFGQSTFGKPLFSPYIPLVTNRSNATILQWVQNYAFFNGTECPQEYRYKADELYK